MKSRYTCAFFAFFGGFIGLDLFYRRHYFRGILNVLFCWTLLPALIGIFRGIQLVVIGVVIRNGGRGRKRVLRIPHCSELLGRYSLDG